MIKQISSQLENSRAIALLEAITKINPDLKRRIRKQNAGRDLFGDGIKDPRDDNVVVANPRAE